MSWINSTSSCYILNITTDGFGSLEIEYLSNWHAIWRTGWRALRVLACNDKLPLRIRTTWIDPQIASFGDFVATVDGRYENITVNVLGRYFFLLCGSILDHRDQLEDLMLARIL
mmetsp:Transcript_78012/g.123066  ORF Transcript_78012/g.123066 Transcript_78012/m.123066 type:complete len:114 (+) Transcript_78012:1099-1440(+)